jgi:hypothetical protein
LVAFPFFPFLYLRYLSLVSAILSFDSHLAAFLPVEEVTIGTRLLVKWCLSPLREAEKVRPLLGKEGIVQAVIVHSKYAEGGGFVFVSFFLSDLIWFRSFVCLFCLVIFCDDYISTVLLSLIIIFQDGAAPFL